MRPAANELLARYIAEVDGLADRYKREFTLNSHRGTNLDLTSHKALAFFVGDTIKAKLADLIQPGGMPEAERLSRLRQVREKLGQVVRELDGIIVA